MYPEALEEQWGLNTVPDMAILRSETQECKPVSKRQSAPSARLSPQIPRAKTEGLRHAIGGGLLIFLPCSSPFLAATTSICSAAGSLVHFLVGFALWFMPASHQRRCQRSELTSRIAAGAAAGDNA